MSKVAQRVVTRFLMAGLSARKPKEQLESLKRERAAILEGKHSSWNNDYQARQVAYFVGWKIDEFREGKVGEDFKYGHIVHTPYGDSFKALQGKDYPALGDWLRDKTNYVELLDQRSAEITGLLRAEQQQKKRDKPVKPGGNLGTCPCCFNAVKLRKNARDPHPLMVIHGYKRPGIGFIDGRCHGHSFPPFELSKEGTESWLVELASLVAKDKKRVAQLTKELALPNSKMTKIDFSTVVPKEGGGHRMREEVYTPDHPDWDRALKRYRYDKESEVSQREKRIVDTKAEISYCKSRAAAWKPVPLV